MSLEFLSVVTMKRREMGMDVNKYHASFLSPSSPREDSENWIKIQQREW